jgi:hypothetical protein
MIEAPGWCRHAVPTPRGWIDPITGELLKSQRISDLEIEEYHSGALLETPASITQTPVQTLTEAPTPNKDLSAMTKVQLMALAEQYGIDVNTRDTKTTLLEKLNVI